MNDTLQTRMNRKTAMNTHNNPFIIPLGWETGMSSFFERNQFLFLTQQYFTPISDNHNVVKQQRNNLLDYT
jgi:hypothetical protein